MTGKQRYRDHDPGTTFEAVIDPQAETWAVARDYIRLLERSTPALRPGTYTAPTKQEGGV